LADALWAGRSEPSWPRPLASTIPRFREKPAAPPRGRRRRSLHAGRSGWNVVDSRPVEAVNRYFNRAKNERNSPSTSASFDIKR
jgi:hypothetical protein